MNGDKTIGALTTVSFSSGSIGSESALGRSSSSGPHVDHAFVSREAGDRIMMARHRDGHERVRAALGADFCAAMLSALAPEVMVDAEQATVLWPRILRHKRQLERALGRRVFIAVACLDYLHQITGTLHHPVLLSEVGHAALIRQSTVDSKTGVLNHAAFSAALNRELALAERHHHTVSLLLIDVDGFKRVNARYGHVGGDRVLRQLADALRGALRVGDVCARYGGDEFAVIAPHTEESAAGELGERLRSTVAHVLSAERITISLGVASWPERGHTSVQLIEAADAALFGSKRAGGNQLTLAGRPCEPTRQPA